MFKTLFNAILPMLISAPAIADDFHLLELNRFSMEVSKIGDLRDPYYPYPSPRSDAYEKWLGGVATNFDLALMSYRGVGLFWDNRVHAEGTNRQFRTVGWEYKMRLQLGERFNLYHAHHSRHVLDADSPYSYPLENRFAIETVFFKK